VGAGFRAAHGKLRPAGSLADHPQLCPHNFRSSRAPGSLVMKGAANCPTNGNTGVSYKLSRQPGIRTRVAPQGLANSC